MLISTREAFLGKRQIKDYNSSSRDWILAKEEYKKEWQPELLEIKGLKGTYLMQAIEFKRVIQVSSDGFISDFEGRHTQAIPGFGWVFYYNDKHGCLLSFPSGENKYKHDTEALDKIMNYVSQCLDSGEDPSGYVDSL